MTNLKTGLGDVADHGNEAIDEDPPSYHSGRVRIIGAEPRVTPSAR